MIITEILDDGRTHSYSDAGFRIRQETGAVYDDAVDVVPHTYTETDEPIDDPDDEDSTPEEVLSMLEGVL